MIIRNPISIIVGGGESTGGLTSEELQKFDVENKKYLNLLNEDSQNENTLSITATTDKLTQEDGVLKIAEAELDYESLLQTYQWLNSLLGIATNDLLNSLNNRLSIAVGNYES